MISAQCIVTPVPPPLFYFHPQDVFQAGPLVTLSLLISFVFATVVMHAASSPVHAVLSTSQVSIQHPARARVEIRTPACCRCTTTAVLRGGRSLLGVVRLPQARALRGISSTVAILASLALLGTGGLLSTTLNRQQRHTLSSLGVLIVSSSATSALTYVLVRERFQGVSPYVHCIGHEYK